MPTSAFHEMGWGRQMSAPKFASICRGWPKQEEPEWPERHRPGPEPAGPWRMRECRSPAPRLRRPWRGSHPREASCRPCPCGWCRTTPCPDLLASDLGSVQSASVRFMLVASRSCRCRCLHGTWRNPAHRASWPSPARRRSASRDWLSWGVLAPGGKRGSWSGSDHKKDHGGEEQERLQHGSLLSCRCLDRHPVAD
jgi:hypothetical protein